MPWATEGSGGWWKETGGDSLGSEVYVSLSIEDPGMGKARLQMTQHPCELREEDPGHRVLGCCRGVSWPKCDMDTAELRNLQVPMARSTGGLSDNRCEHRTTGVLVCWACRNKVSQTGWLKQGNYFSQLRRLEVWDEGAGRVGFSGGQSFSGTLVLCSDGLSSVHVHFCCLSGGLHFLFFKGHPMALF